MINAFEGARGLAALLVALYHLDIGKEYFAVLRHAYVFVDLFFVLSGFVICAAYTGRLGSSRDLLSFMIRRFGRLFPLLVFSTASFILASDAIVAIKRLAIGYGLGAGLGNAASVDYLVPSGLELASTLTFTHSLGVFDRLILNTPSWSISTEFYTYLLFAAACLFFRGRSRLAFFSALVLAAFAVTAWASITLYDCLETGACNTQTFDFGFARCVLSFFLGALTFHFGKAMRFEPKNLQLPAVGLLALYFWKVDDVPALSFLPPYLFAALILSLSRDKGIVASLLKLRPCQTLGQRSYSIYLMHLPLVLFFQMAAKRVDGPMLGAAVAGAYVIALHVVSGWTFRHVEDPFRILFNRFSANLDKAWERKVHVAEVLAFPSYEDSLATVGSINEEKKAIVEKAPAHE